MYAFILFFMTTITAATLEVSSASFKQEGFIPAIYSCEGKSINPPIEIRNIPDGTRSLALIMDDPDATKGTFVHWVAWNIDPAKKTIPENSSPGTEGKNGAGKNGYIGPCPPAGTGTHHYHFKVYALDSKLNLQNNAGKAELEAAMEKHILAKGELIGLYHKSK